MPGPAKVSVVGVGPGAGALVTLNAIALIRSADLVAGFASTLAVVEHLIRGEKVTLNYSNQDAALHRLVGLSLQGKSCVVCAYGDPDVSDRQLVQKLTSEGAEVDMVPGISSIQIACARLKLPVEQTIFITFHKRGPIEDEKKELLESVKVGRRSVVALPRPWDFMPRDIARFLLSERVGPETGAVVLQRLTLKDEAILVSSIGELSRKEDKFSDLTILVIKAPETGAKA